MISAVKLLKERGFYGLAGNDGCACGDCKIFGIDIDVSCWRSNSGIPNFHGVTIRVTPAHSDVPAEALAAVGEELLSEISEMWQADTVVRFCSYAQDDEKTCVSCKGPRERQREYLCASCASDPGKAKECAYPRLCRVED